MTRIDLPYLQSFTDRHGHHRWYFRRRGCRRIALPDPASEAFLAAYQAARAESETPPAVTTIGASRTVPGTVDAAVAGYLACAGFQALAQETRRSRGNILERFRAAHGAKRVAMLDRGAVERMVAEKALTPSAARNFLNTLRAMMEHCVLVGLRRDNPCAGVKAPRIRTNGFHTWTEAEVEAARAAHPLGTRARLALELAACTGQRRGDLVRIGRQHVRACTLTLRQQKTKMLVEIPVLAELQAALDAMPAAGRRGAAGDLTWLITQAGAPFSPAGFTNWFREVARAAGVDEGSVHGLRKYAATRLANHGATAHQLMAWFGWSTLAEAERYTRAADRRRLAAEVVEKLNPRTASVNPD